MWEKKDILHQSINTWEVQPRREEFVQSVEIGESHKKRCELTSANICATSAFTTVLTTVFNRLFYCYRFLQSQPCYSLHMHMWFLSGR